MIATHRTANQSRGAKAPLATCGATDRVVPRSRAGDGPAYRTWSVSSPSPPGQEVKKRDEEEHERQEVIKKAEDYKESARRAALFAQENPPLEQWEVMPKYELSR